MRLLPLVFVVLLALAGCAQKPKDLPVVGDPLKGAIRGLVVDVAIHPIANVLVTLTEGNRTATTDIQGHFSFGDVQPGTHFLRATHLLYHAVQVVVEVRAGDNQPDYSKVQMVPVFTKKPYVEQVRFKGLIECGYSAVIITAPCVTDYSTIACAGGCVKEAHYALVHAQGDQRAFNTTVGADWQTIVIEITFQSNGQGTSDRMGVLMSYYARNAGHWFGSAEGKNPVLLRFEVGERAPSQQGDDRPLVNATGNDDLLILASIATAEGQEAGVGVAQEFEVIQTNFYNAKPPAGWSFVGGSAMPF